MRESSTRTSADAGAVWVRRTLVVSEIALAYVLLVGAGLLTRSFVKVLQVDLGFAPEHTVSVRVDTRYLPLPERITYYDRLVERVATVPGIESVGLSDTQPLGFKRAWALEARGDSDDGHNRSFAYVRVVDHHCLQTLRIRLHAGRYFNERDTQESERVMIVSETMARNLWPNLDPLGQTVRTSSREYTVVGVVSDVTHGLEEAPQPDMYLNMHQTRDWGNPEMVVRAPRAPALFVPDVRAAIKAFDPTLASNEFTTLEQIVDRAIAPRRLFTGTLSSFSTFGLLLAAMGLYGVIAYSVSQRTQEIGIRLALGAQRGNVLGLVVGEGLRMAGIGVAIGLAAAFFVTRLLQSQLYGVTTSDPFTYALTATILVMVTLLACYIPARRAARIDPMEALRYE
jgi:predicted permease